MLLVSQIVLYFACLHIFHGLHVMHKLHVLYVLHNLLFVIWTKSKRTAAFFFTCVQWWPPSLATCIHRWPARGPGDFPKKFPASPGSAGTSPWCRDQRKRPCFQTWAQLPAGQKLSKDQEQSLWFRGRLVYVEVEALESGCFCKWKFTLAIFSVSTTAWVNSWMNSVFNELTGALFMLTVAMPSASVCTETWAQAVREVLNIDVGWEKLRLRVKANRLQLSEDMLTMTNL